MDQIIYNVIDDGSATAQSHSLIPPGLMGQQSKIQTVKSKIAVESQMSEQNPNSQAKQNLAETIEDQASKESTDELSGGPRLAMKDGKHRPSDKVATLKRSKDKGDMSHTDEEPESSQAAKSKQTSKQTAKTGENKQSKDRRVVGMSYDSQNPH